MTSKNSTFISEKRKAEYKATYDRLMARAAGRLYEKGVHERHHIVPRSLGGSNDKSNIVCLTYREHFLAHWLLTKFIEGKGKCKMLHALSRITNKGKGHSHRIVSGWQYEISRKAKAEAMTGENHPMFGLTGDKSPNFGRPSWIKGISPEKHPMFGKPGPMRGRTGENSPIAKSVICLDDGKIFGSIVDAAKFYGIKAKRDISFVCLKKRKTAKGLHFEYANKAA